MPGGPPSRSIGRMDLKNAQIDAHVGDWLEAPGRDGKGTRIGEIVEILGWPGREHFQVRWDQHRESMVFPGEGVRVVPKPRP